MTLPKILDWFSQDFGTGAKYGFSPLRFLSILRLDVLRYVATLLPQEGEVAQQVADASAHISYFSR